ETRRDLADALLMVEDLRRHVRHPELVDRGLADGGVALSALALHEVAGGGPLAVALPLDRPAADEIEVVVPTLDELVGREVPRAEARHERRDDLGGEIAQRTASFEERVREEQIGALAHRGGEERLLGHET